MKLKLLAMGLVLAAGLSAKIELDAPDGLTLTVDASENGTLTWEPISRDDLMGYSIWMRAGTEDFTRLNIPTKVGAEVKKLPMTSKSFITLKGLGKRALELRVLAEYESGRSEPSRSAFTKRARRIRPDAPAVATAPETGAPPSDKAEAGPAAKPTPAETAEPGETSAGAHRVPARPDMAAAGTVQTSLTGGIAWQQTVAKGYNSLGELGYTVVGDPSYDYSTKRNWVFTYTERKIMVPLTIQYGVLSSVEIGADIAWVEEEAYAGKYDFGTDTFQSYNGEAAVKASGFDNPALKVKIQPSASWPLRLSLRAHLATGARSRLQAFGEYVFTRYSSEAGLDDNNGRLEIRAEYGDRNNNSGLVYDLEVVPASSEKASSRVNQSTVLSQRADRGQEIYGSVAYIIPWKQETMPGSLIGGLSLRSIDPGRWVINDVDVGANATSDHRAQLRSFTGLNLGREDQMEVFVELRQNIYSIIDRGGRQKAAVDSAGRFSFINKPDGWIAAISGGFYY